MKLVILIAIVGYIVYIITKDYNNDVKENVTNFGGMRVKYSTLIDYLISGGLQIQKITKDCVLLSSRTMNCSLDYVGGNIEVRMNGFIPILGNFDKKWVFPSSYSQEKMIIEIENYLTWEMEQLKDVVNNNELLRPKKNIIPRIDIYTASFDKHINDIFPNSKDDAIYKIVQKLNLSKLEAAILFERWQKFYLIDYHPHEEWIPNPPLQTITVQQFKHQTNETKLSVKYNELTKELYFDAGDIRGKVSTKGIPSNPMFSQFITYNSEVHWILHEEGEISAPTIAIF